MLPDLDSEITPSCLPRGSIDLGGGYVLLRARDESSVILEGAHADAFCAFMASISEESTSSDSPPKCTRWAHLRLPNLQIARSAWKELACAISAERVRCSRNVKVNDLLKYCITCTYFVI